MGKHIRRVATAAWITTGAVALGASGAQAAPAFRCSASALHGTILAQSFDPVTAGSADGCTTTQATPSASLPGLLEAQALQANTSDDGTTAAASGGLAHLSVLPLPALAASLPTEQAIDALPTDLALPLPGLGAAKLDVQATVRALVPIPGAALLSADVVRADASATCADGAPALHGSSTTTGLAIGGQPAGADSLVPLAVTVLNTRTINLSSLGVDQLVLSQLPVALQEVLVPAIHAAVALIPPITLPASVITGRLSTDEQVSDGSTLTQRALHAELSIAGTPVLDSVIGEATAGVDAASCAPAAPPASAPVAAQSVADQLLACTDRKLVLVDVLKHGSKVQLLGAANRDYAGRDVAIRLKATNRVVAHATVQGDGSFTTTAPAPAVAMLAAGAPSNRVRYQAEIGSERSLPLKLLRRTIVTSLTSAGGRVTIAGHLTRPFTTPMTSVRLMRRISCSRDELVTTVKPKADGSFKVTVDAPSGSAAVYRLASFVRAAPTNPRKYPTFSLPRGVALDAR